MKLQLCHNCQAVVERTHQFCPSCGHDLQNQPPIVTQSAEHELTRDQILAKLGMFAFGIVLVVAGVITAPVAFENLSIDGLVISAGLLGGGVGIFIAALITRSGRGRAGPAGARGATTPAVQAATAATGLFVGIAGGIAMAMFLIVATIGAVVMLMFYVCTQTLGQT